MDRKRGKKQINMMADDGYLLLTTLYFLVISVIFTSSMIQITSSQMMQYNQLTHAYQAKAAINMSRNLLQEKIEKDHYPESGVIKTTKGDVYVSHRVIEDHSHYSFELAYKNGITYQEEFVVQRTQSDELEETMPTNN